MNMIVRRMFWLTVVSGLLSTGDAWAQGDEDLKSGQILAR